jgi:O-antigen/teichoic acid export membrane protein
LLISLFFFAKNPEIIPRLSFYSRSKINDILKLGGNFFVIQIAVLLIFTVDNFIVLQLLGTEQVSVYNVVFKLFSVFTLGFGIIIAPLWSAFTEAHAKNDFAWMKKTIMRLNKTVILVFLGLVVMLLIYQPILDFWLPKDKQITPNFMLVLSFSFFILISIWNNIYSFFLNGVGIVKMQVRTSVVGAILNIPLAILFVKVFNFGLTGIVLSMSISLFIFSIFGPIETYNFLKKHSDE